MVTVDRKVLRSGKGRHFHGTETETKGQPESERKSSNGWIAREGEKEGMGSETSGQGRRNNSGGVQRNKRRWISRVTR